ncbi:hypothetical protein O0I10_010237 [Lichtheimia ornata]|uniref:Aminopeptidase n=1 Tax=Lichtheimia ornata TaxID=688661 RepID=A0AAD7UXY6_9FUNG|nr:uncharacterized protein O0I10_010237 [Lichtheimia ornata]KAJ8654161.1 hypothetical protein O0I10_010237 [Lichtheimia ornata]
MPHICSKSKSSSYFASANAVNQYAPDTVIEPIHLDISLHLDDLHDKTLKAKVITTFAHNGLSLPSCNASSSTTALNAEAFQHVKVSGASFSYDGHRIQLKWDTPFAKDEQRKVTIDYIISHPTAGLYFQNEDSIMGAQPCWLITDHETEKARYWLPTVDYPTVRTTLTWDITAPQKYTSLANGKLLSDETKDGYTTTRWQLDYPCPSYLVCFAVGEFISVDAGEVDGRPIKYFTAEGYKQADLERAFDKTPEMIRWLEAKVGVTFPWPKYYQIALPAIRGAMENISLVTWTDTFVIDEKNALERKYLTDLVNVHEMAHTYFGDLLVIRHFEHAWLKVRLVATMSNMEILTHLCHLQESWATYMESCWLQDKKSENDFRYEMMTNAKGYIKECAKYMRPIVTRKYDSSWDMFDGHTYPGGAWRIHMLRKKLGDEAFWAGVKLYIDEFAKSTVQTSDFQRCLERASQLNLQRFFDEWVYSKGYPTFKGSFDHDLANGTARISLTQTQVSDNDNIPLFGLDMEIELTDDKGQVYNTTLTFDREATAMATIHLNSKDAQPKVLRVDPEMKLLYTLEMSAGESVLQHTATEAADVQSRVWAYNELVKLGTYPALSFVADHIVKEPFYGVRIEVSSALAKLKSAQSLQILAHVLKNEKDPMALWTIASVARIEDNHIRDAALERLSRHDELPYRAHAALLVVLAEQHRDEDLEYLLKVAKDDSKIGQHGLIRGGALKALGYHRSEEAFQYLISRVGYNIEPMRARFQAVDGLAYSTSWQTDRLQKQAKETLVKLARDPNFLVRMTAVESLVSLGVKSSYNDVAYTRYLYSEDDQSWLDRKLYELYHQDIKDASSKANQELIEKLEGRLKSLEDKLQKLTAAGKQEEA